MKNLKIILSLGLVSHKAVLMALGYKQSYYSFTHNAFHDVRQGRKLANSYHTSRYNINTGRLTQEMFEAVIASIKKEIE